MVISVAAIGFLLENNIGLQWLFRLRGAVEPPPHVVVVALDEASAIALGVPEKPREWPRSLHGRLIDALVDRGADVIAFDLTFERPQPPAEDAAFAQAMAAAQRVLLVEAIERRCPQNDGARAPPVCYEELRRPVPVLAEAALGLAPFPLPRSPSSSISAFWAFLGGSQDRATLPALAVQAQALRHDEDFRRFFYAATGGIIGRTAGIEETVRVLRQRSKSRQAADPLLPGGEIGVLPSMMFSGEARLGEAVRRLYAGPDSHFLNFYGPAGTIRHIPYSRLLDGGDDRPLPDLNGAAVFVGSSELGKPIQSDHFLTAFPRDDGVEMSGAEVAATAYANLATGTTLRPLGLPASLALTFGLSLLLTTAAVALPLRAAIPATLALALGYAAIAVALFSRDNLWLPLAGPLLVILPAALAIGTGTHLLRARRQRRRAEAAAAEAEAASAARAAFLATMSHEVRTLLNWVTGLVAKLDRPGLDDVERGLMARVRQFSDGLLQLLNDVLDLAKLDAGELRIVREPVALRPLIQAVADMVTPAAQQKGLVLSAEVAEDVPPAVIADPLRLCQMLWNLLGNAIKFTERGFIRVRLDAEAGAGGEAMLVLRVEDSGIGIAEAAQAALFQPFRQAEATTARRFGGSGLGLAIVRHLAGLMGGTITLQSRPGAGSTFTIRLPVPLAPVSASDATAPLPGLADLPAAPLRGSAAKTPAPAAAGPDAADVVVAEDDPLNRILIEGQLGTLGLAARLCASGEEAWDSLQRQPARLLITDLQMASASDGIALARRLRADARFRGLPIIGLTADARPGSLGACLAAGMNLVLLKPLKLPDLPAALASLGIAAADASVPVAAAAPSPADAAAAADEPVVDAGNLVQAFGALDAPARQMLAEFVDQAAAAIAVVSAAAHERDAARLQRTAHRLAGSSAAIGAVRLGRLFAQIDAAADTGAWQRIDGMTAALAGCLAETRAAIVGRCADAEAAPPPVAPAVSNPPSDSRRSPPCG